MALSLTGELIQHKCESVIKWKCRCMRAMYLCMYHAPSCKAILHCSRTHSFPMCSCICILCTDMQSFPCIHQCLSQNFSHQHQMKSGNSSTAKPILKCIFKFIRYSRSWEGHANISKRTRGNEPYLHICVYHHPWTHLGIYSHHPAECRHHN